MRLHVTFDDTPEFETLIAMQSVCRGVQWTLTNTDVGEDLKGHDEAVAMLDKVVRLLEPGVAIEKTLNAGQPALAAMPSVQSIHISA